MGCFIGGKCIEEGAHEQVVTGQGSRGPTYGDHPCSVCKPSVNGNGYTPIASGCMLAVDMSKFEAACYDDKGSMTMSETDKIQLMVDKVSLTSTVAERDAEIASMEEAKTTLLTEKAGPQSSRKRPRFSRLLIRATTMTDSTRLWPSP